MRLSLTAAVAVVATALFANTGHAQDVVVRERLLSIKLVDNVVNAEAYYNGSSFSGGGIMSCIATYRVTVRNARTGAIIARYDE
ncbi:MAG: hypothetical protein K2V38_08945, partial [Gemmataceae bacterium]|nr:hypothetical protein [Gemmataceae bacterium]